MPVTRHGNATLCLLLAQSSPDRIRLHGVMSVMVRDHFFDKIFDLKTCSDAIELWNMHSICVNIRSRTSPRPLSPNISPNECLQACVARPEPACLAPTSFLAATRSASSCSFSFCICSWMRAGCVSTETEGVINGEGNRQCMPRQRG